MLIRVKISVADPDPIAIVLINLKKEGIKEQCHEKSMPLYHVKCCFCLQNEPQKWVIAF